MEKLSVSLIQTALFWEDKEKNLEMLSQKIEACENTDIIILPEMFSTGFSMNPEMFAEDMSGNSVNWMRERAIDKGAVIVGSLIIEEEGKYYNRLIWMSPDGELKTYDKRHLFSLAGEEKHYAQGKERLIVEYKGWRICPLVCYDLRFPVWSRNDNAIDLYIYVANWPERRNFPWTQLLKARAIENLAYVIGVNRVGDDGNGVSHSGDSVVLNPLGEDVYRFEASKESVKTVDILQSEIKTTREKFSFLNDRDQFTIEA